MFDFLILLMKNIENFAQRSEFDIDAHENFNLIEVFEIRVN